MLNYLRVKKHSEFYQPSFLILMSMKHLECYLVVILVFVIIFSIASPALKNAYKQTEIGRWMV